MSLLKLFTINFFIISSSCEGIWHSYEFGSGYGNREELVITDVAAEDKFASGDGVKFWKSVSFGKYSYAVGLMVRGLTIVKATLAPGSDRDLRVETEIIDLNLNITNIEVFHIWNSNTSSEEIVLITLSKNSTLSWYRLDDLKPGNEKWSWTLQTNISHLQYSMICNRNNLLVISNSNQKNEVLIYEFDGPSLWLTQVIPLSSAAENLELVEFGPNTFLLVSTPHQNMVQVFKLKQERFVPYQNITSAHVSQVQSFKIGFKSFIAINGGTPGIYKFTKRGLLLVDHGLHLEGLDFWFLIPVRTYRDDAILIGQHLVHHDSHKSILVEPLVFNGENFVYHEQMPCFLFGVKENGLTCMIDEESETGLRGSAVLNVGTTLGVLVPGTKHSRLFTLRTVLKALKSPAEIEIEKLQETKIKLQQAIDEQHNKIKSLEEGSQNTNLPETAGVEKNKPRNNEIILGKIHDQHIDPQIFKKELEDIEKGIKLILNKLNGTVSLNDPTTNFDELIVNGDFEIKGMSSFGNVTSETLNGETLPGIFNDLVRQRNVGHIKSRKTFTEIDVHSLTFQRINGKDASEIVFNTANRSIVVNGNLTFENVVEVSGDVLIQNSEINGHHVEEEMVQMNKKYPGQLNFATVKMEDTPFEVDTITVDGNLTITNINDENTEDFIKSICLINNNNHIPGDIFITDGVVNVTEEVSVNYLNGLRFPEEYVLQSTEAPKITGEKQFKNNVVVQKLLVDGTVNEVDPDTIVTMNNDQELSGSYLFNDLEVTEGLGIDGDVSGNHVKEFLENPILTESNEVKASINFQSLEVDGVIVISGDFNNSNFADLLGDVVYAVEDQSLISSIKSFPHGMSVANGIHTSSNAINTTPLDQFVTTDTEQALHIQSWNGDIHFVNLHILGLYDGVNITQLDDKTVKLTGEQFVTSTLSFENIENSVVDLSATEFTITNMLNDLPVNNYLFTSGESRNLVIDSIIFENVIVEDVIVDGDVFGEVDGFSIGGFDSRRVSATRNQTFIAEYKVDYLETVNFKAKIVNGIEYEKLFDIQYYADIVSNLLFDGKLKITNLQVGDSVFAQAINGIDLGILQRCFWTNKNNYFKTAVFMGDVFAKSLNIGNFNSVNFQDFTNNIVKMHEKNLTVNAFKTFTNGFHVVKFINSDRLNGIPIDDILTKSGSQEIRAPLNIYGDVVIYDTEVHGNLNEISMEYLSKTFEFVDNTLIVNDDMVFNRLAYIDRLWVDNYAQEFNVNQFLANIVFFDQDFKIPGTTVFNSPVYIQNNFIIEETINKVDLSEFIDDIVVITKPDTVDTSLIFNQYVYIENDLFVSSTLDARLLLGIDLQQWKYAAFVNEGLIPGTIRFEAVTVHGNLYTSYVNDIAMSDLIPLRTEQVINGNLVFGQMKTFNDITVGNYVNGYKLAELLASSVHTNIHSQIITSPITFTGNILIREHLHIDALMNGKNISNIVSTNTDQTLSSKIVFNDRVTLEGNLNISTDKINDISLSNWKRQCMFLVHKPQEIYNRWIVGGNVTFKGNVDGTGLIGGFNLRKMADDVEAKRFYKSVTERNLVDSYTNMCKDVNTLMEKAQNQIYLFKYFEKLEPIRFDRVVSITHSFTHYQKTYLLVGGIDSCTTILFVWDKTKFIVFDQINTGSVDQFISVYDRDLLFIISNGPSTHCEVSGTNTWKFESDTLMHLFKMENHQLLHDSSEQGTFYGLIGSELVEYKVQTIVDTIIKKYRKWNLEEIDNLAFAQRGVGIGLALYNSKVLMELSREDSPKEDDRYGYETNECIVGKVFSTMNTILPTPNDGNLAVLSIGANGKRRSLLALAQHEQTSVKGKHDFIKFFEVEDIRKGILFHKIPADKPSSLVSLEFGSNGETLVLFLESQRTLQVYEYKGIEGFKQRTSIKLHGSKLITFKLPMVNGQERQTVIGVVNNNEISFLQAEMVGNQLAISKIDCDL